MTDRMDDGVSREHGDTSKLFIAGDSFGNLCTWIPGTSANRTHAVHAGMTLEEVIRHYETTGYKYSKTNGTHWLTLEGSHGKEEIDG